MQKSEALPSEPSPVEALNHPEITPVDDLGAVALASAKRAGEIQANQQASMEAYYGAFMSKHGAPNMDNVERLGKYKDVFITTATRLFSDNILKGVGSIEHNPPLSELGSILTSLDHNAGVYYAEEDVADIFRVVAEEIFDEDTKKQLSEGDVALTEMIDARTKAVSSVDSETALPLVKNEAGAWKVADAQEYGQADSFTALEVLRQDNADKVGWNKYRFRTSTYTRRQDTLHTKQVAEDWYTSEWYKEPNYWSATIRDVIAGAAKDINERLTGSNTSITFITEGGVFKGTSTAGTDIDTHCNIVCDSKAQFDKAYQSVRSSLLDRAASIPFSLKGEGILDIFPVFYDRSSGDGFRRTEGGEYEVFKEDAISSGEIVERVRKTEKGILVTAPGTVALFNKPSAFDKREVYVAVSDSSGVISQTANRPNVVHRAQENLPQVEPDDWDL